MKTILKKEVIEATCDICGEDCMIDMFLYNDSEGDSEEHENIKDFEGMELHASWGYMSNKDCESWDAVICEECVDKHLVPLIKFMKIEH